MTRTSCKPDLPMLLAVMCSGEDDPLDGLSPAQIVLFCEKYGIDPTDPLEVS